MRGVAKTRAPRGAPSGDNRPMDVDDWMQAALALAYRVSAYALLNLADDAAFLAILFC